MIPRDLHFLHSEQWIHLIWLIPLTFLFIYSLRKQLKDLKHIIADPLIPLVTFARNPTLMWLKWFAFALAWGFAILALMTPQGDEFFRMSTKESIERIEAERALNLEILIDASQSMGVEDVVGSSNRLSQAKGIATLLLRIVPNDQVALATFTSQMNRISPLTYDHSLLRLLVQEIRLNEGDSYGTNFKNLFEELGQQEPRLYLLFSDGGDNQKVDLPELLQLAKNLKSPIITIGIGSEQGGSVPDILSNGQPVHSKLDSVLLQQISEATSGRYFAGSSFTEQDLANLLKIYIDRKRVEGDTVLHTVNAYTNFKDYFQIPLALSLLFFLLYKFLPTTLRASLICLMLTPFAIDAKEAGQALFARGKFEEAISWYRGELLLQGDEIIQDKIFYNLALSYRALEEIPASLFSQAMISPKAFEYPLFKEKILSLLQGNQKEIADLEYWLTWLYSRGAKELVEQFPQIQALDHGQLQKLTQEKALEYGAELQWATLQKELSVKEMLIHSLYFLGMYRFISANFDFDQLSRAFNQAVMREQNKQFLEKSCNCDLWDQLVPLFSDGIDQLKAERGAHTAIYAFLKWSQAYHLLQNPPANRSQQKEDLQELQTMQTRDEIAPSQPKQKEGIPW